MADARVTQSVIEILSLVIPDARVTQSVIEILSPSIPSIADIRVTQVLAESAQQYSDLPTRVTQVVAESAQQYSALPTRISGVLAESVQQYAAVPMRVSQIGIEVLRTVGCFTVIDVTPPPPPARPGCPPASMEPRAIQGLDGCPSTL